MFINLDEAKIGFMDERRRFQGLAGFLLGQPLGSETAKLIVNQRQELAGSAGVPVLYRIQKLGDVAVHYRKD